MDTTGSLHRFRSALLADSVWQDRLMAQDEEAGFVEQALQAAAELDLTFNLEELLAMLRDDTVDPQRGNPHALVLDSVPPAMWLPVALVMRDDAVAIEWLPFAPGSTRLPFFNDAIAATVSRPFTRAMHCITPLAALAAFDAAPPPDGLIFHMSRCGSTLVTQMLAAVPNFVSLSEVPLVDLMIRLSLKGFVSDSEVRAVVAALSRERGGAASHRFIKLDPCHMLALPQLLRIFPDTPWVFLYRDPAEVLVSQKRSAGMHVTPGAIPIEEFGVSGADAVSNDDYPAWVLAAICEAALAASGDPNALLVAYPQLPQALTDAILPHFGVSPDPDALERMQQASQRHSKRPTEEFSPDSAAKQAEAQCRTTTASEPRLNRAVAALDASRTRI